MTYTAGVSSAKTLIVDDGERKNIFLLWGIHSIKFIFTRRELCDLPCFSIVFGYWNPLTSQLAIAI
jgi:hypothetical protein